MVTMYNTTLEILTTLDTLRYINYIAPVFPQEWKVAALYVAQRYQLCLYGQKIFAEPFTISNRMLLLESYTIIQSFLHLKELQTMSSEQLPVSLLSEVTQELLKKSILCLKEVTDVNDFLDSFPEIDSRLASFSKATFLLLPIYTFLPVDSTHLMYTSPEHLNESKAIFAGSCK